MIASEKPVVVVLFNINKYISKIGALARQEGVGEKHPGI
jgi:hypothetical protein